MTREDEAQEALGDRHERLSRDSSGQAFLPSL